MRNRCQRFIKFFSTLMILGFAKVAWAQGGLVPCSGPSCTICHVLKLISNIALYSVKYVMPPLAGLLFLVGGIMMIVSAGSEERYKKGRQVLINTAIGVVIVLASWLIINTLIVTLGQNVAGFQVQNWWQPPQCP